VENTIENFTLKIYSIQPKLIAYYPSCGSNFIKIIHLIPITNAKEKKLV